MSKPTIKGRAKKSGRRYIFNDALNPNIKVYLVYYYNIKKVALLTDGPFKDEASASNKMREFLIKGYCAWMVSYND